MSVKKLSEFSEPLVEGMRVRIKHTVRVGARNWPMEVTGVIVEVSPVVTGIHTERVAADDFWVQSVSIQKKDGELSTVTCDEDTEVEVLKTVSPS